MGAEIQGDMLRNAPVHTHGIRFIKNLCDCQLGLRSMFYIGILNQHMTYDDTECNCICISYRIWHVGQILFCYDEIIILPQGNKKWDNNHRT